MENATKCNGGETEKVLLYPKYVDDMYDNMDKVDGAIVSAAFLGWLRVDPSVLVTDFRPWIAERILELIEYRDNGTGGDAALVGKANQELSDINRWLDGNLDFKEKNMALLSSLSSIQARAAYGFPIVTPGNRKRYLTEIIKQNIQLLIPAQPRFLFIVGSARATLYVDADVARFAQFKASWVDIVVVPHPPLTSLCKAVSYEYANSQTGVQAMLDGFDSKYHESLWTGNWPPYATNSRMS